MGPHVPPHRRSCAPGDARVPQTTHHGHRLDRLAPTGASTENTVALDPRELQLSTNNTTIQQYKVHAPTCTTAQHSGTTCATSLSDLRCRKTSARKEPELQKSEALSPAGSPERGHHRRHLQLAVLAATISKSGAGPYPKVIVTTAKP